MAGSRSKWFRALKGRGYVALALVAGLGIVLVGQRLRAGASDRVDARAAAAPHEAGEALIGEAPAPVEQDAGIRSVPVAAANGPVVIGADSFPAPAPLLAKPAAVRGVYLNAWAAGSSRRRAQLIELAERSEINTFVIDVKEGGEISYRSGVGLARAIGADRNYIPGIRAVLDDLRSRGIYTIARIVVFRDPVLAQARPQWAIQQADGGIWRDAQGKLWIDPHNREVWDYNIAIAREAVLLGFSEVQWDYVRFPDVPQRLMRTAVYPARDGQARDQAIREFLLYSRDRLADLGVPVTADVFGLTVSVGDDLGIGQKWEMMADATDALLPMVYPSHFARGSYGIPVPNADPYRTVKTAMEYAVRRTGRIPAAAAIRPWLQDFTLGWPRYGPAEVRAQIQATYDAGIQEWILWNPGSRYNEAALADRNGVVPDLPIPRHIAPPPAQRDAAPPTPPQPMPTPPEPRLLGQPVGG